LKAGDPGFFVQPTLAFFFIDSGEDNGGESVTHLGLRSVKKDLNLHA